MGRIMTYYRWKSGNGGAIARGSRLASRLNVQFSLSTRSTCASFMVRSVAAAIVLLAFYIRVTQTQPAPPTKGRAGNPTVKLPSDKPAARCDSAVKPPPPKRPFGLSESSCPLATSVHCCEVGLPDPPQRDEVRSNLGPSTDSRIRAVRAAAPPGCGPSNSYSRSAFPPREAPRLVRDVKGGWGRISAANHHGTNCQRTSGDQSSSFHALAWTVAHRIVNHDVLVGTSKCFFRPQLSSIDGGGLTLINTARRLLTGTRVSDALCT